MINTIVKGTPETTALFNALAEIFTDTEPLDCCEGGSDAIGWHHPGSPCNLPAFCQGTAADPGPEDSTGWIDFIHFQAQAELWELWGERGALRLRSYGTKGREEHWTTIAASTPEAAVTQIRAFLDQTRNQPADQTHVTGDQK